MPPPPRMTERMLLALHDAGEAVHGTHRQVHDALRAWERRIGHEILTAAAAAAPAHEDGTGEDRVTSP
ncbi:MAG: hypothetical protein ACRDNW_22930 [Trebonia sp.]